MQKIPYALTNALIKETTDICQELRLMKLRHLIMAVLFNNGTTILFSTDERIVKDYYNTSINLDELMFQKKFFDYSDNHHSFEASSEINETLNARYKLNASYSLSRVHAEGRFVFTALRDSDNQNNLSAEDCYAHTKKKVEKLCIRYIDAAIYSIMRLDSSYEHSFILTNKALRDAVIKQGFDRDINLSYIERKCIWLSFLGNTAKEMAKILKISPWSVQDCLTNIRTKFDLPLPQIYLECMHRGIIGKFIQF